MTTHDEQTNTTTTPTADDDSAARQEYSSPGTEPATAQPRQSAAADPGRLPRPTAPGRPRTAHLTPNRGRRTIASPAPAAAMSAPAYPLAE